MTTIATAGTRLIKERKSPAAHLLLNRVLIKWSMRSFKLLSLTKFLL